MTPSPLQCRSPRLLAANGIQSNYAHSPSHPYRTRLPFFTSVLCLRLMPLLTAALDMQPERDGPLEVVEQAQFQSELTAPVDHVHQFELIGSCNEQPDASKIVLYRIPTTSI